MLKVTHYQHQHFSSRALPRRSVLIMSLMAVFTLLLLAKYSLSPSHQIDYAAGVDGETVVVDMITNYHGPAVVSEFSIRQDHMFGECLARGHTLISCSADEYMHAEALVHPAILLHPFPRSILILGNPHGSLINSTLLYFTLASIEWLPGIDQDKTSEPLLQQYQHRHHSYDDILNIVKPRYGMNVFSLALSSLKKHSYDVILLDMTRGETDMADFRSLKSLLKPGGVLSVSAGTLKYSSDPHHENWKLYRHINNLFRHTHPYTQHRPCTDSLHFYLMAFDSDTLPNPSSLHPSYVDKWVDRRTTHVPVHYDSETHMSFFNGMPSWIRRAIKSIDATIPEHSSSASSASTANAVGRQVMLPYYEGKPVQTSFVKGNFFNREFYGCEREALSQVDTLERAMIKALEYAHAKNTSTIFHYIQHDLVNMTFSQSPTRGSSSSAAETTTTSHDYPHMIQLSVFFEGGQISVKTFPHLGYAHILVDNRNEYYDFDEAVNHLALHLERVESVGYDRTFGARSSEYPDMTSMEWEVKTFESSKFVVKKSDTAGLGQYAIRMIKKGELVFFNRIDTQLRAEEELFPKGRPWQNEWQQNMVEEVFDGKYTAPRLSDSFDDVTLYTNHNCDPNLWYEGTYDSMVARRDIRIGEELTYDYATVDTDTSFKCNCGSKMCRKNVTGSDWMMKGLQDRYGLEHFFPNVRRLIVEDRRKHEHLHHHNH